MKRVLSLFLMVALLLSLMPTSLFSTTADAAASAFAGGSGTEDDPYLISNSIHLNNVRYYLDAHFKLICNISLTSSNWSPIGSSSREAFTGTFDGNGFVVKNLEIESSTKTSNVAGLFGYNTGVIKNLCVSGGTVFASSSSVSSNASSSSYAGGVAGYNSGTIRNCYNMATISAYASGCGPMSFAGGIAGYNGGIIQNCHNEGKVNASARDNYASSFDSSAWAEAGGIAGRNRSSIECCYNISAVSTSASARDYTYNRLGGIAGYDSGRITNCYYLDIVASAGGSGDKKCTAEQMEQQSTYVGFDFENAWVIDATIQAYPFLRSTHYHIYENYCDSTCNNCGYYRTAPHNYEWKVDKENNCAFDGIMHEECTGCHIMRSENTVIEATGNHIFSDEVDTECDVCGGTFYQIIFNNNGGTSTNTIITQPGDAVTLPSKPTRYSYIFAGWAATKNGDAIYQPGTTYSAVGSITLYAQWNKCCVSCSGVGFFECSSCGGDGTLYCTTCSGSGKISIDCSTCSGSGYESYDCGACDGVGKVNSPINCSKCSGYGWTCNNCGRGVTLLGRCSCGSSDKYYCDRCGGSSANNWVPCTYCSGTGTRTKICSACSGKKEKTCSKCYGDGFVDHNNCDGTGKLLCTKCNGTGAFVRTNVESPAAPTLKSITANTVILNTITNGEYSIDGTNWQDSPIFENLEMGKEYYLYQRYAKTDTTNVSAPSEVLVVIPDHIYDDQCDTTCNVCGYIRTITHSFEWIIDQEETCSNNGIKHEECTICHVKRKENTAIPASGVHSFDNACDTTCNTCNHTRTTTHSYKTTWDKNAMQHWHQCSVCGNKKDLEDHIFDNACDTICNTCGYTRTITHDYKTVWEKDAIQHWHECSICGTKKDTTDHIYNNACDTTCNTCAYVRTVDPHVYDNVCDSTCNICGFRRDNIEHSYDNACDATCNLCGTIRTPGEHVYDDNDDHYCNVCNLYTLLRYQINYWNNSVTITGFDENYNGAFVIPETINGYPVTEIESYAFYNCSNLTSITIPNSISRIWGSAFSGCDNLSEVHISDISAWCNIKFSDLDANPISCGYFGDYYRKLFLNGSLVTDIVFPDGITAIGDYAFYGYSELKSVEIPDSVTSIGDDAFRQCTKLEGVVIPNNVITIGDYAFAYCESMKTLTLGNQVSYIGECTFAGCDITEVTIPKSVTTMGNVAFCGDTPIKIEIENIESWCNIQFNGAIVWQEQGLNLYMNGNLITDLVIPEGVTTITNGAFAYCTNLKSVSFPNSLIAINDSSFYGCTGITSVVIPQNVSSFSVGAFKGCTALASLSVVDNNATYHSYGNCIIETDSKTLVLGIKNSTIPSDGSVTIIGDFAFDGCNGLKYVVIPNGVTTIKRYAFWHCEDLVAVDISNSVTSIEGGAFEGCMSLTSIALPAGLTILNQFVFEDCYSLTNITIPKSMTRIMYAALRSCPIENIYYSGSEADKDLMEIGDNNGWIPYATWHYNTCETHTYDNACDTTCNECGYVRAVPDHVYNDENDRDCNECGYVLYVVGDLDGEVGITDADAVYLLYHTFLPDLYPVDQSCDFDGDGYVTDADAVYLLYYTFLPDLYPLH